MADLDARRFFRGYTNPLAMMGVKVSAFYRFFNAIACNESYVLKANLRLLADDILEGFPDSAILRIDIVLFCFFPYIEWLPLS